MKGQRITNERVLVQETPIGVAGLVRGNEDELATSLLLRRRRRRAGLEAVHERAQTVVELIVGDFGQPVGREVENEIERMRRRGRTLRRLRTERLLD